tara:strand:- start:940 stop:1755 length:816 start_codon:yes stop_codon:yes gene_type:complete
MKIFLDIGSHIGQTLYEVTKEKYAFDKIYCFEPSLLCLESLEKIASTDSRINICKFGLSNRNQDAELYMPGSQGGTIFEGGIGDLAQESNNLTQDDNVVEKIMLRDANEWFTENINPDDYLVVKTNCEGSEVDILDSLIDGGFMENIYTFLVTFDIRENPKYQYRELEVRKKLKAQNVKNFCFSDDVMIGFSHEQRIENWLKLFGVDTHLQDTALLRNQYQKNFFKYASKNGFLIRWETKLKRGFGYSLFPDWIKNTLRFVKRKLGLNRER